MVEITATLVRDLRETTGAGMMDCKKALVATDGDIEAAVDWLRKKGLSAAARKSGRVAAEGLIAVSVAADGKRAAIVEVNAETDFVGRNDKFQAFVAAVADKALTSGIKSGDVEALKAATLASGATVQDELTQLVATIGEHMTIRRVGVLEVTNGHVSVYMHNAVAPNLGKIGVLVALESLAAVAPLTELGKQLAMHVAAARPEVLAISDVETTSLDRERAVLTEQARAGGKPEEIIAKMVEGRLRKYYEEVVLLEQIYVVDGETKVAKVVENIAAKLGAPVVLSGFVRYHLGEGIEKVVEDFAAEVAKIAG